MSGPIKERSELDGGEKSHGTFFRTGTDAAIAFDTADKVLIFRPPIVSARERLRTTARTVWRVADARVLAEQACANDVGLEAFVAEAPPLPPATELGFDGKEIVGVACQLIRMRQHPDHARRWPPAFCWPRPSSGRSPAQPVNRGDRPLFERTKVRAIDLAQFPFLALRSGLKKTAE